MAHAERTTRFLLPVARGAGRVLFDLELSGAEHVPAEGAVLFAANHFSHLDPVLVSTFTGRAVRYLAVDELFGRHPGFDRLTLFFGAIPMSRVRAPLGALRTALDELASGGAVGLYPEGRRVESWGAEPPRRGAAWLAFASGAPLIPIAIQGSHRTLSINEPRFRRVPIRVSAGPPLRWEDHVDAIDPLGSMMAGWVDSLQGRLGPWYSSDSS